MQHFRSFGTTHSHHRVFRISLRICAVILTLVYDVTIAVIYGVIYLSILNTVNRGKGMDAIKTWYGGDRSEIVKALKEEKEYLGNSFKKMIRKRVSGER